MERKEFARDLVSFIDTVMYPHESFARLFEKVYDCPLDNKQQIKADFMDVAMVSGALTSLTRHRLHQFASRLQEQIGCVYVKAPVSDKTIEIEVTGVEIYNNDADSLKQ